MAVVVNDSSGCLAGSAVGLRGHRAVLEVRGQGSWEEESGTLWT